MPILATPRSTIPVSTEYVKDPKILTDSLHKAHEGSLGQAETMNLQSKSHAEVKSFQILDTAGCQNIQAKDPELSDVTSLEAAATPAFLLVD